MQDLQSRHEQPRQHPITGSVGSDQLPMETISRSKGLTSIKNKLHRWIKNMLDQIHPSGITMMDL